MTSAEAVDLKKRRRLSFTLCIVEVFYFSSSDIGQTLHVAIAVIGRFIFDTDWSSLQNVWLPVRIDNDITIGLNASINETATLKGSLLSYLT